MSYWLAAHVPVIVSFSSDRAQDLRCSWTESRDGPDWRDCEAIHSGLATTAPWSHVFCPVDIPLRLHPRHLLHVSGPLLERDTLSRCGCDGDPVGECIPMLVYMHKCDESFGYASSVCMYTDMRD